MWASIAHVRQDMQKEITSLQLDLAYLRENVTEIDRDIDLICFELKGVRRQQRLKVQEMEESRVTGLVPKSSSDQGPEQRRDEIDSDPRPFRGVRVLEFLAEIGERKDREEALVEFEEYE